MKRLSLIFISTVFLLMGCKEENTNVYKEEEVMSEETQMFASGMATSEEKVVEVTVIEEEKTNDGEIEIFCPTAILTANPEKQYGSYEHGTYYSETCKLERGYSIMLPADYSEEKKYPVLYMLHGIFGDEYSFTNDPNCKIKELVGNMSEDMIVVFPNMYATSDPEQKPGFDNEACLPYDNFINDLVDDLMPHINEKYSVLTDRDNTYLAGFSMGGRETIYIALMRPELFGYVCAISAAPGVVPSEDRFMKHEGMIEVEEVKFADDAIEPTVFIICCGTNDSVVGKFPLSYHNIMTENGVNHIWYEITGADHDNKAINSGIYNLLKQIDYNHH